MTEQEYRQKYQEIQDRAKKETQDLMIECAYANNPYFVGDIFTDHIGSIVVEGMKVYAYLSDSFPCMIYFGTVLKKDGTPRKIGEKRWSYQSNDIKK